MNALGNHAAGRADKAALFADVGSVLRQSAVWVRALREESMYVGQTMSGKALIVVVKLPQREVTGGIQSLLARCNEYGGCGFVVRDVRELAIYLGRLG